MQTIQYEINTPVYAKITKQTQGIRKDQKHYFYTLFNFKLGEIVNVLEVHKNYSIVKSHSNIDNKNSYIVDNKYLDFAVAQSVKCYYSMFGRRYLIDRNYKRDRERVG